jgi:N12 class adenine-specific DNA methylase
MPTRSEIDEYLDEVLAQNPGVPPDVARRLIGVESGYRADAVSPKGARGIMQVMPATFREMGGTDPNDWRQNIKAGVSYLAKNINEFGDVEKGVAAYHAGPGAVRRAGGIPNTHDGITSTPSYVRRVAGRRKEGSDDDPEVIPPASGLPAQPRRLSQQAAVLPEWEGAQAFEPTVAHVDEAPTSSTWGDTKGALWQGTIGVAKAAREGVRQLLGDEVVEIVDKFDALLHDEKDGNYLDNEEARTHAKLSPEMQEALQKKWVAEDDEGGVTFGPAWTDWRSYYGGFLQSLPGEVVTMVPAFRLARAAQGAAVSSALARGVTQEAAEQAGAKALARTATVAGGLLEGGLQAGGSADEVRREILKMGPDNPALEESAAFKALVEQNGGDRAAALKQLADDAATQAYLTAGVATAIFGGQGDRVLANLISGRFKGTTLARMGIATLGEGGEEFGQGYSAKVAENIAKQKADPSIPTTEGALNEGVGGAVLGGMQGAATGAAFGGPGEQAQPAPKKGGEMPLPALGNLPQEAATPEAGPPEPPPTVAPATAAPAPSGAEIPLNPTTPEGYPVNPETGEVLTPGTVAEQHFDDNVAFKEAKAKEAEEKRRARAGMAEGDIGRASDGGPFGVKSAANLAMRSKKLGDSHEVVQLGKDAFVLRPKAGQDNAIPAQDDAGGGIEPAAPTQEELYAEPPAVQPGAVSTDSGQVDKPAEEAAPGAPLTHGFKRGPNAGERYRAGFVASTGGVALEKRNDNAGTQSTFYIGNDGNLLDADNVNMIGDGPKPWKPATEEQKQEATAILDQMGALALNDPKRAELKKRLKELVTSRETSAEKEATTPVEPTSDNSALKQEPVAEEPKRSYASTQVALPKGVAGDVMKAGAKLIAPEDVHPEKGMEKRPHVTVKYGLHDNAPEAVKDLVANEPPVHAKITGIEVFEPEGEDYDVVVARVDSPDLVRLNAKIAALPHTDTFPDYKPHITLGYVKKGTGQKYADAKSPLIGRAFEVRNLEFSDQDENLTRFALSGKAAPKPENSTITPSVKTEIPAKTPTAQEATKDDEGKYFKPDDHKRTLDEALDQLKPAYGITEPQLETLAAWIRARPQSVKVAKDGDYTRFEVNLPNKHWVDLGGYSRGNERIMMPVGGGDSTRGYDMGFMGSAGSWAPIRQGIEQAGRKLAAEARDSGETAAKPAAEVAAEKPKKSKWKEIGKNTLGDTVYEDPRGVRSILVGGSRLAESVSMSGHHEGRFKLASDVAMERIAAEDAAERAAKPKKQSNKQFEPGERVEWNNPSETYGGRYVGVVVSQSEHALDVKMEVVPPGSTTKVGETMHLAPPTQASGFSFRRVKEEAPSETDARARTVAFIRWMRTEHPNLTPDKLGSGIFDGGTFHADSPPFVKKGMVRVDDIKNGPTFRIKDLWDEAAPPEAGKPKAEPYGTKNKVFTADAADKAREILRKKLGTLNAGLDPEVMHAGLTLAGYHIEAGARAWADYAKAMVADLGEAVRPYLRSWYESARHYPGFDNEGMTPAAEIPEEAPAKKPVTPQVEAPAGSTPIGAKSAPTFATFYTDAVKALAADEKVRAWIGNPDNNPRDVAAAVKGPFERHVLERFEATDFQPAAVFDDLMKLAKKPGAMEDLVRHVRAALQPTADAPTLTTEAPHGTDTDAAASEGNGPASDEGAGAGDVREPVGKRKAGRGAGRAGGDVRGPDLFGGERSGSPTPDDQQQGEPRGTGAADRPDATAGKRDRAESGPRVPAKRKPELPSGVADYHPAPGAIERTGSWREQAARNLDVIELVKKLEEEKRHATPEEQATLSKWTGWGASELSSNLFQGWTDGKGNFRFDTSEWQSYRQGAADNNRWVELRQRADDLMSQEEKNAAARSTQYAHYTSEPVIRAMWAGVERMGFKGGRILEPGAGIGLFPVLGPPSVMEHSAYTGIEFEPFTAKIAKHLLPEQNVLTADFTATKLPPAFFDLAIGNPPFAKTKVLADPEYKRHRFSLHDYFFAKTIDRVRPGGVMAFVTSRYSMDKASDAARKYISDRADLVAAFRLPRTAFLKNAGTEVVTDILIFQRRAEGQEPNGVKWAGAEEVQVGDQKYLINEYFAAHPDHVLGKHSSTGSMYSANEYTVDPAGDLDAQLLEAMKKLPENIISAPISTPTERQTFERDMSPKAKKEGQLYVGDDGEVYRRENGTGVRLEDFRKAGAAEKEWFKGYVGLRDAMKQARYDQLTDGDWKGSLKALNKAYDAFVKKHGRLLEFTETERTEVDKDDLDENGKPRERTVTYRRLKHDGKFKADVEGPLVMTLEAIDGDGNIQKGTFLLDRALAKPEPPKIETAGDALAVSLSDIGHLDINHVADLAKISVDEAVAELGDAIYFAPGGNWQTADEYLSGDVVKKLEEAQAAAAHDPAYERNVQALLKAQPKLLGTADITVGLGSPWVAPEYVSQFAEEELGIKATIRHNDITGQWTGLDGKGSQNGRGAGDWATQYRSPMELLDAALNARPVVITVTDSDKKTIKLPEESAAANEKVRKMREAFSRWVFKDADRTATLLEQYNKKFNNIATREFDGSHLRLPGLSLRYKLFDHQKRAIWRQIQTGNTYLAHAVGAGKTLEMIVGGMEQKRLGLIKLPMYVVPNHMLNQFAAEFLDAYPAADIMVADEANFHTDNRKRFVAQAAMNQPDAIIITHSGFGKIRPDPEAAAAVLERMIGELQAAVDEIDDSDRAGQRTRKQIEQRIEQMEQRFGSKANEGDDVVNFAEMGVDMLYVDEAHEFRKLDFVTNRNNVKGITPEGSKRALDLYIKVKAMESKKPGRSHVFASGTPVTNTLAELYSIQRFMDEDALEADGFRAFDSWAAQFGEIESFDERNAAGAYEVVERFAKFVNVPELMSRVRSFMDVLTSNQLKHLVKVPTMIGDAPQVKVSEAYPELKRYMTTLAERIKKSREWKPSKDEPNNPDPLINIITDARIASIDTGFVTGESHPKSKLNAMIDEIIRVGKETAGNEYVDPKTGKKDPLKGGTQIVFSAVGFGAEVAKNRGFDVKGHINKRLAQGGIKPDQIAWISDYNTHAKKEGLFRSMREGKVRVLFGSPKNMGTGVNVQKRLVFQHYLSPPWYPADEEQPRGRIIRQGNQNDIVGVNWYATKETYDSTQWQMIARKARFIEVAMTGGRELRKVEDVSEASQYEQASALASGDARVIKYTRLKRDIDSLTLLMRAHADEQWRMKGEARSLEGAIERGTKRIGELKKLVAAGAGKYITSSDIVGEIKGARVKNATELGQAVLSEVQRVRTVSPPKGKAGIRLDFGTLNGAKLTGRLYPVEGRKDDEVSYRAELSLQWGDTEAWEARTAVYPDDEYTPQQIASLGAGIAKESYEVQQSLDRELADVEDRKEKLSDRRKRIGVPFDRMQELADKTAEAARLRDELMATGKDPSAEDLEREADAILAKWEGEGGRPAKAKEEPADAAMYSLDTKAPVWRSALAGVLPKAPWSKAGDIDAPQLGKWLEARQREGAFKADELAWSGLTDWLSMQRGKVAKAAVESFLDQNGVKVTERMLGGRGADSIRGNIEDLSTRLRAAGVRDLDVDYEGMLQGLTWQGVYYEYQNEGYATGQGEWAPSQDMNDEDVIARADPLPEEIAYQATKLGELREKVSQANTKDEIGETQYHNYQLPGGENYRELLLTLPQEGQRATSLDQRYEELKAQRASETDQARIDGLNEQMRALRQRSTELRNGPRTTQFQSGHWSEPNILAHVRFNERKDAEGDRVLFIEEIQSDWAQKGRKSGFAAEIPTAEREKMQREVRDLRERANRYSSAGMNDKEIAEYFTPGRIVKGYGGWDKVEAFTPGPRWDVKVIAVKQDGTPIPFERSRHHSTDPSSEEAKRLGREAAEIEHKLLGGVPRAPFVQDTKAWTALALKRMIRYATDNGFDRVAWANGEQQADRYDLSKHIGEIEVGHYRAERGEVFFRAYDKNNTRRLLMERDGIQASELDDYIGKDAADKARKQLHEHGRAKLTNLDLKIGGEGMVAFYDKIVPQVANDVLKKMGGGKVETLTLGKSRLEPPDGWSVHKEDDGSWVAAGPEGERAMARTRVEAIQAIGRFARYEGETGVQGIGKQMGFDITPAMRELAGQGVPMFKDGARGPGSTVAQVEGWTQRLRRKWRNAPTIRVVQHVPAGRPPNSKGMYQGGTVTLYADNIRGPVDALNVILHEVVGHAGLRGLFGERLTALMRSIYDSSPEIAVEARRIKAAYEKSGKKITIEEATEEVLANMAGDGKIKDLGLWKEIVAAIRAALRAIGVDLTFSDNDIRALLARSRRYIERGDAKAASKASKDSRFSLAGVASGGMRSFNEDGLPVDDLDPSSPVYLRIGKWDPKKEASRNYAAGTIESGLSVYDLDDNGKPIAPDGEWAETDLRDRLKSGERQYKVQGQLVGEGHDGEPLLRNVYIVRDGDEKAAPGEQTSGESDGAMYSLDLGREVRNRIEDRLSAHFQSAKTFNVWHRTVGTQYHKAEVDRDYKRVFDATQRFVRDTAQLAMEAADKAPTLLPKLEDVSAVVKDALGRGAKPADVAKVADATFRATLADERWDDAKLKAEGLNDTQIKLFHEARDAIDKSLDDMTASVAAAMVRKLPGGFPGYVVAQAKANPEQAREIYLDAFDRMAEKMRGDGADPADLEDTVQRIEKLFDRRDKLKAQGYAPLMRFGRWTVEVRDDNGVVRYFSMHEKEHEAKTRARQIRADEKYEGMGVSTERMSQKRFELFQGVSPETLALFAEEIGEQNDPVFQEYLKIAISSRSALTRLIHRKGIAGYNEDLTRVLAQFLTSNARMASRNYHYGEMVDAAGAIPESKGDVVDDAVDLIKYVQNPQEEAQAVRGFLFINFLGGSFGAALVNMTQPITMTLPYLSQFVGTAKASAQLAAGMAIGSGAKKATGDLEAAMKRAEKQGHTAPHEVHMLQAEASNTYGANPWVRRGLKVWGSLFALAESFNRKATFAAAYELGKGMTPEQLSKAGARDAYSFAVKAVEETQGIYNKANRPNWARGAVGATIFTFKQFSIAYLEFLKRLPPKERLLALAILFIAGGAGGLPFGEDIQDLIDAIGQAMGYNTNSRKKLRELAVAFAGETFGPMLTNGMAGTALPFDIGSRVGVGNLIPGSGAFKRSKTDVDRDMAEIVGPVGGVYENTVKAGKKLAGGEVLGAARAMAPVAIENALKGAEMWQTGQYKDQRGRRVADTSGTDAIMKGLGLQPTRVAEQRRKEGYVVQNLAMAKVVKAEVHQKLAEARVERDPSKEADARAMVRDWNAKNPEDRISINHNAVQERVKEMRRTSAERIVKHAPKAQRGELRRELIP